MKKGLFLVLCLSFLAVLVISTSSCSSGSRLGCPNSKRMSGY